jgi:KaiC/GvpD/RAD55 family RecA-like ATPase
MQYVRLCKTLVDKGILIPENALNDNINDHTKDWYSSVFFYNQQEFDVFKKTGTIAGITGLTSNKLIFDFDSQDDLEAARSDTLDICNKLITNGITEDQFNICFSGNKGFSIELRLSKQYSSKELKGIAKALAGDKTSFDTKVYNDSRIFRIPYTKHNITGLYKTPISLATLSEASIEDIKAMAVDNSGIDWKDVVIELPESLQVKLDKKINLDTFEALPSFERKAKWMPSCKEAILNGMFKNGNRSHALMALAATFKANGFPKEVAYRSLKGAAELQAKRYNTDAFDSTEIWTNIISVVYSPNWKGATYSCRDHEWLEEICKTTGKYACALKEKVELVTIDTVSDSFSNYATNIDKNTIKTGIDVIDDNLRLQTCSHAVIAGSSGSGKTTLLLNILNNVSDAGSNALFGSMDMGKNLIYQKLAHKVTGLNDKDLYDIYRRNDTAKINKIKEDIYNMYKNVLFDFRSGVTIEDLTANLRAAKEKHGDSLKLVVYDFINKIRGPFSEETANLAYIAPRLSDLANETETLIISLAQTARSKGGPSTPLVDSRVSKGSSAIEESATAVLGIWRPGYMTDEDKYMCIGALKTRMGKEFVTPLSFDGLTGNIRGLSYEETVQYENFIESLEETKNDKGDGWT